MLHDVIKMMRIIEKSNYIFNNPYNNGFLYLSSGGIESTEPGHHYGPGFRSGHILTLILSGNGYFSCNGETFNLSSGSIFYCNPNVLVNTVSDTINPWKIAWIRFTGDYTDVLMKTTALGEKNSFFSETDAPNLKNIILNILEMSQHNGVSDLNYVVKLIEMIDYIRTISPKNNLVKPANNSLIIIQATQYIKNNFDRPITVSDLVSYLDIDRTYLFRIFKDNLLISPKAYLTAVRIKASQNLLLSSKESIKNIAVSCGYNDYIQFSKAFKKQTGQSPSQYRNDRKN